MNSAPTRGKSSSTPHPMSSERNFLELLACVRSETTRIPRFG